MTKQSLKKNIRELLISNDPDNVHLGLILNSVERVFPYVAKFYEKYKRFNFWQPFRTRAVYMSMSRYYAVTGILNNELQTFRGYFWCDYADPKHLLDWQAWQMRISYQIPLTNKTMLKRTFAGHPYTAMFC